MRKLFRIFSTVFIFIVFWVTAVFSENPPLLPTSLPIPQGGEIPRSVSIALLVDVPMVLVATEGSYEIHGEEVPKTGIRTDLNLFLHGEGPFKAIIKPGKNGIEINREFYPAKRLILKVPSGFIQVEKRRYYDQVRIFWNSEKSLTVVNRVDIDEYVKGVLPLEVHHDWPIETLKAHAVVSRTFALFKSIEKQGQNFSLRDTVQSQVYGGALFHKSSTDQAIEATRGEILTFHNTMFPPYFHANCGGRTVQADQIWAVKPSPVLKSIACHFCKGTKHSKWSLEISLAEIEAIMQKRGFPAKNLKRVSFNSRNSSGRISKVILEYQRSKLTISANDFRTFIGYDRLKSLNADIKVKNGRAYLNGFGWGHGVGFCQWGAKRQAEIGKTYREILEFYFPGSEIRKI